MRHAPCGFGVASGPGNNISNDYDDDVSSYSLQSSSSPHFNHHNHNLNYLLVMASIDPQDLVCAWLDIPFLPYRPRSPVSAPIPLLCNSPHHQPLEYQDDEHRDLLYSSSHGSLLTNPSPLHQSLAPSSLLPSPPPHAHYSLLQENDQGHSVSAARLGKRRRLNPAPVRYPMQSPEAHLMFPPQDSFIRGSNRSLSAVFSEPGPRRMVGLASPRGAVDPVDPVHQSEPQPPGGPGQEYTAPEGTAADDALDYVGRLEMAPPSPSASRSKKRGVDSISSSPSKTTATVAPSEIRAKRQFLEHLTPSCIFGPPALVEPTPLDHDSDTDTEDSDPVTSASILAPPIPPPLAMPPHVLEIILTLSPSTFERGCIPNVPDTRQFLDSYVPYEQIHAHSLREIHSPADHPRALALLNFAYGVHRTAAHASANALDEAAWYPLVRSLLAVTPSRTPGLPNPPPGPIAPPAARDRFVVIDATTKITAREVLPSHPAVKLDVLLAFNHKHRSCAATLSHAAEHACRVNPLSEVAMGSAVVVLGIEVKATGGGGGMLAAEYQLGVFGLKTLEVARVLRAADEPQGVCDVALGVSVCGHVWALHVTYWGGEGRGVTHGPVVVGATDTLVGTMKLVAFVEAVKRWARQKAWPEWRVRIGGAVERGLAEDVQ